MLGPRRGACLIETTIAALGADPRRAELLERALLRASRRRQSPAKSSLTRTHTGRQAGGGRGRMSGRSSRARSDRRRSRIGPSRAPTGRRGSDCGCRRTADIVALVARDGALQVMLIGRRRAHGNFKPSSLHRFGEQGRCSTEVVLQSLRPGIAARNSPAPARAVVKPMKTASDVSCCAPTQASCRSGAAAYWRTTPSPVTRPATAAGD